MVKLMIQVPQVTHRHIGMVRPPRLSVTRSAPHATYGRPRYPVCNTVLCGEQHTPSEDDSLHVREDKNVTIMMHEQEPCKEWSYQVISSHSNNAETEVNTLQTPKNPEAGRTLSFNPITFSSYHISLPAHFIKTTTTPPQATHYCLWHNYYNKPKCPLAQLLTHTPRRSTMFFSA